MIRPDSRGAYPEIVGAILAISRAKVMALVETVGGLASDVGRKATVY